MEAEKILKNHGLRLTGSRIAVLEVFLGETYALSHSEIEYRLKENIDRVTIYRTIHSFLEKGIVHKVMDDSEASKYALCDSCDTHDHHDNHVHFKCEKCGVSECLNDVQIPVISIPVNYTLKEASLLIEGVCPRCK